MFITVFTRAFHKYVEYKRKQEDGQTCVPPSFIDTNLVLRGTFGLKREERKGDWRKLHEELHNLCALLVTGF
jgi:hypothetical protein